MKQLLLIMAILAGIIPRLNGRDIYVALNGSDGNPGTFEAPYLTLAKASTQAWPGDVVYIREGVYEETLLPTRSGNQANPITFMPYNGEKVVISAMQALEGWTLDEGSVYKTTVNWDLGQRNFVMNGDTVCDLARWPNNTDGDPFTLNSLRNDGGSGPDVASGAYLDYNAGIPDLDWSQGGSIFFYGDRSGWLAWKAFITSNTTTRLVFDLGKNPTWIRTHHSPEWKGDFYLEGIREAIDYDNEWYFNPNSRTLYLQIPGGGAPADGQISMRKRLKCIDLSTKHYVIVKNLTVIGGTIEIGGSNNHLYGVYSYFGNFTRGVFTSFSSNEQSIKMTGAFNTVEKCEVAFGSGNGIKVEGSGNRIINCSIHDFNYLGSYDAPVNMRGGSNSVLKQNTIYRGGRDCVQMFNRNSEIAFNDISRSNIIATDCGLLYTVGGPYNMKIHHNWLHDTWSRGTLYKAAGIYLDNNANDFLVHHNVVWNTEWSSIQMNLDCKDIDVFNNTFWDGSAAMGAWHKEGTSFSDVRVWNNLANRGPWEPQSDKQNNLSIITNPFINSAAKDFRLKQGALPVDYGRVIDGITGTWYGEAPDAGAYETGGTFWKAGIDWDPELGPDFCAFPGVYIEEDGYVVIEGESAASPGDGWQLENEAGGYTGTGYLTYSGPEHQDTIVDTTITAFKFEIHNPGTYMFRSRVTGTGGYWIHVDCDNFVTVAGSDTVTHDSTFVLLENSDPGNWSWETSHEIFATFGSPGIYAIHLAGATTGYAVDRLTLYLEERAIPALDTISQESNPYCGPHTARSHWASGRNTEVTQTDTGMEIDGMEDNEWQYSDTIRGTFSANGMGLPIHRDLGFVFSLAYDQDFLYLIAHVEDDVKQGYSGENMDYGNWDNVELFFNPDKLHNLLGRYGDDAIQIRLSYGMDGSVWSGYGTERWEKPPDGFAYASTDTETGYIMEARIPWNVIIPGDLYPDPGLTTGFEIQVNDRDSGKEIEHMISWANDTEVNLSAVDTRRFGLISLKAAEYKYVNKSGWQVLYADSEESPGSKEKIIDGSPVTHWSTKWRGGHDPLPHEIQIDFIEELNVKEIHLLPRQDAFGPDGSPGEYEIYLGECACDWINPVASGELSWPDDLETNYKGLQIIRLDTVSRGRFLRILLLSEAQENPEINVIAIAELDIITGDIIEGVEEGSSMEQEVKIWPNPVTGTELHILFPTGVKRTAISIISSDGRVHSMGSGFPGNRITLGTRHIPPGISLVRVSTEKGIVVKRIVIQ